MKLTNKQVSQSLPALQRLGVLEIEDVDLAWDIGTALREISNAADRFEAEKAKLIARHGAKDADGKPKPAENGMITVHDPVAYSEDIQKMLDIQVDINTPTIQRGRLKGLKITGGVLAPLDWFITS